MLILLREIGAFDATLARSVWFLLVEAANRGAFGGGAVVVDDDDEGVVRDVNFLDRVDQTTYLVVGLFQEAWCRSSSAGASTGFNSTGISSQAGSAFGSESIPHSELHTDSSNPGLLPPEQHLPIMTLRDELAYAD
ncbi:hypothetical protein ABFA25_07400 [Mycobacterium lepromatosis]|uniref:hypothetical protein n=1 Tax=Mycobacterium lepromatosis TaxID=480418 RepID=UPI0005F7A145|nr:hypothetical protein [Mycobacterium lepromatosis]